MANLLHSVHKASVLLLLLAIVVYVFGFRSPDRVTALPGERNAQLGLAAKGAPAQGAKVPATRSARKKVCDVQVVLV